MRRAVLAILSALAALPAPGQQSASFRVSDSSINAGSVPLGGQALESAGFRVTLAAIGDATVEGTAASPSYFADPGFVQAYAPPQELSNLRFVSKTLLTWNRSETAIRFDVYRGRLTELRLGEAGNCHAPDLPTNESDEGSTAPAPNAGLWFYLVVGENRLGEQGSRGTRSDGTPRTGGILCP